MIIAGAVLLAAGVTSYSVASSRLGDRNITVAADADHLAGHHVTQPREAYAEATVIAERASDMAGGRRTPSCPGRTRSARR